MVFLLRLFVIQKDKVSAETYKLNIAYIEGGKPFSKVGIFSWLRQTFQRNFYQFQWLTVHERSLMNEREVAYFWNNFPELTFFKMKLL